MYVVSENKTKNIIPHSNFAEKLQYHGKPLKFLFFDPQVKQLLKPCFDNISSKNDIKVLNHHQVFNWKNRKTSILVTKQDK